MGLDHGKNIYALPGRVSDKLSEGCNNLIKMGAKLVTSPMDILEDYYISNEKNFKKNVKIKQWKIKINIICLNPMVK